MEKLGSNKEIDKKEVGKRIKEVRLKLGETAEKFGEHFNPPANRGLVSGWENGRYLPAPDRLKIIAELGGVTVQELLRGDKRKTSSDLLFLADKIDIGKAFKFIRLTQNMTIEETAKKMSERNIFTRRAFAKKVEITPEKLIEIEKGNIKPNLEEVKRFSDLNYRYDMRDILENRIIFYHNKETVYKVLIEFYGDIFDKEKVFDLVETINKAPVMGATPPVFKSIYDYMLEKNNFTDYETYKSYFLDGIYNTRRQINSTEDLNKILDLSTSLNDFVIGYLGVNAYEEVYQ